MPPKSIYLPDELIGRIEEDMDEDQSFSQWIQQAARRQLDGDFDDLEELTAQVDELQEWKQEVDQELLEWFKSEFGPAR